MTKVLHLIDNKKYTTGVFLDLTKAFDTVDHQILLGKLTHFGIRGFGSFLTNRKQKVNYKKVISDSLTIKCGVPQGLVLGLLLFYLFK